jgi:hypothetical protein
MSARAEHGGLCRMEIGGVHMKMPIRIVDGRLDEFVATLKEPGWNSGNGAFSINSQKVESVAQRLAEDDLLLNHIRLPVAR